MRAHTLPLAIGLLASLACAGLPGTSPEESPSEVIAAAPPTWPVTTDETGEFVAAGTNAGLVEDAPLTVLGPPLAGTEHREIVGAAKVTKVWEDLCRIERERWNPTLPDGAELVARARLPEDTAELEAIPEFKAAAAPTSSAGHTTSVAPTSATVTLPPDLTDPSPQKRYDAVLRYEPDPSATAYIVTVMKTDTDLEVRKKAWRVLRARWKRGTGSRSEHEAAATWAAAKGDPDVREEAINALGDQGSSMSKVSGYLSDPGPEIRRAAGDAVAAYGGRTGKREEARSLIQAALAKESDSKTRKAFVTDLEGI